MPTAKKIYTFNETIVETGAALLTGETDEEYTASMKAVLADESNYIAVITDGTPAYLVPMYGLTGVTEIYVLATQTKPVDLDAMTGDEIVHLSSDGDVIYSLLAGYDMEITDMGCRAEWIAANTTTNGLQIDVESPNGVKLLLEGKLGKENIAVVPKLTEQTVTPTAEAQTVSAPEGYAGFKSFIVDKIPSQYVIPEGERTFNENGTHDVSKIKTAVIDVPIPDGYVPEGTVPDGYVKPEGAITVTENVTDMDISEKKTLTVAVEGGAKLNIAYGDTAPDDTTKLWVKTAEPLSVEVKLNADFVGNEEMENGIATLSKQRDGEGVVAVGNNLYIISGGSSSSTNRTVNIYIFDTITMTMTTATATMPNALWTMSAEAVGTDIYIFGGERVSTNLVLSNMIYKYDTVNDKITTLTTLPSYRQLMGSAVVGKKIYLFGGRASSSDIGTRNDSSAIIVYDTEYNTVQTLTTKLPYAVNRVGTASVGTKIYLFGGYSVSNSVTYNTISIFDTETDQIETLQDISLSQTMAGMSAESIGKKIYLFGGWTLDSSVNKMLNTIAVFDTESKEFHVLDTALPIAIRDMGSATIGSKAFLVGGYGPSTSPINAFIVSIDLPENNMLIELSGSKNMFNLLPNMEMGVKNVYLGNADGKGERVAAALYKDGSWVDI